MIRSLYLLIVPTIIAYLILLSGCPFCPNPVYAKAVSLKEIEEAKALWLQSDILNYEYYIKKPDAAARMSCYTPQLTLDFSPQENIRVRVAGGKLYDAHDMGTTAAIDDATPALTITELYDQMIAEYDQYDYYWFTMDENTAAPLAIRKGSNSGPSAQETLLYFRYATPSFPSLVLHPIRLDADYGRGGSSYSIEPHETLPGTYLLFSPARDPYWPEYEEPIVYREAVITLESFPEDFPLIHDLFRGNRSVISFTGDFITADDEGIGNTMILGDYFNVSLRVNDFDSFQVSDELLRKQIKKALARILPPIVEE